MGGSVTYGFSGNPDSVSIQTGSYTIPAGKYAQVTAFVDPGSTFSIDGTTVLTPSSAGTVQSASANFDNSTTYTVPSGYAFSGVVFCSPTGNTLLQGKTLGTASAVLVGVSAGPGAVFSVSLANTGTVVGSLVPVSNGAGAVTASYWVPTGTVLNTSGGKYVVQLFS